MDRAPHGRLLGFLLLALLGLVSLLAHPICARQHSMDGEARRRRRKGGEEADGR